MSKDDTAQPQKPPKPVTIPVYVVTEHVRPAEALFLGIAPDLVLAQWIVLDQLPASGAYEWMASVSKTTGETVAWRLREPGVTYTISLKHLAYTSDDAHRAAVLLMAAEILKAEFGSITVEHELTVLRRVARQLAPGPGGEKAQEDRSWEG